ncbi:MAG: UDP-N-acetylmuramoyl-L-alanine--D-glutamate ligase [Gammaproteobacteria bacterium]
MSVVAAPDSQSRRGAAPVLIVGLGVTGLSCARYFARLGQPMRIIDSRSEPPGLEGLRQLDAQVDLRLGELAESSLQGVAEVVVSPGVPLDTPIVSEARQRGLDVAGDIELFARAAPAPVAAITGSNGKSTVTQLTAELLAGCGLEVRAGGNLGPAALNLLEEAAPDCFVLELSSFQLELTESLHPKAATVLNLSADHMDRHGSLERYAAAKARIFRGAETAVVNREDPAVRSMAPSSMHRISFGLDAPGEGHYGLREKDGASWLARGHELLMPASELSLAGRHNIANALAALAMTEAMGADPEQGLDRLRHFPGLPHRTQRVGEIGGVVFIDDSKGTNVGAAVAAILGMTGPVVLIAGGDGKGADFAALAAAARDKVHTAVLLGRDADRMAAALEGVCAIRRAGDMDQAVQQAAEAARAGDTVLLSPACASTDMFSDYTQRGRIFVDAVGRLAS